MRFRAQDRRRSNRPARPWDYAAAVKRFFIGLVGKIHASAELRRRRALQQAAREMQRRDPHGGSIWRSGKGGSHPG
jgi:hypothetical protein